MNAMSPAIAHNAHSGVSPITTIASRIHGNVRYEPAHRRGRSTSDFDFGAELDDLTGGDPEIGWRFAGDRSVSACRRGP